MVGLSVSLTIECAYGSIHIKWVYGLITAMDNLCYHRYIIVGDTPSVTQINSWPSANKLKNLVHPSRSFFAMLCKQLVHYYCSICLSIWQTLTGPRSNLPLLYICGCYLFFSAISCVSWLLRGWVIGVDLGLLLAGGLGVLRGMMQTSSSSLLANLFRLNVIKVFPFIFNY